MNIAHERFVRVLLRCIEVSNQPGIEPVIAGVYSGALSAPADAYLAADAAVNDALIHCEKESSEAIAALGTIDVPYKVARSALKAVHPSMAKGIPATLKALPTDTDKLKAIQWLVSKVEEHAGEPWAAALIAGEFGVKAAASQKEIEEAITAGKTFVKAQTDRAAAGELAYERYLDFKQVVRDARGSSSREYRRIHLRASAEAGDEEQEDLPAPSPDAPAQPATP